MAQTRRRKKNSPGSRRWPDAGKTVQRLATSRKRQLQKNSLVYRFVRFLGVLAVFIFVTAASFLAGAYFGLMEAVGEPGEPKTAATAPTYIYSQPVGDTEGSRRVIGTIFHGENRKTTSLEQMPPSLLNALVAKEDERFREHPGVDSWGILRALYADVRAGKAVEGASTITQQYVRNAYLSRERTISRKLKEAALAIKVERRWDKEEILAKYLNTAYFGGNAYGAEAAAETYFDRPAEDLTVAQSAALIGLLWSPSTLGTDRAAATTQRNLVLQQMFSNGYITEQQYTSSLDKQLPEPWPKAPVLDTGLEASPETREFAELVRKDLVDQLGANTVYTGGLEVDTTLDLEAQAEARDVLYGPNGYLPYPDNPDAALVSIQPETGNIKAMVGDRDENSQFDLVTQSRRQPGSSFKPFALVAALEQGIDPATEYVSEKKSYEVEHRNGRFETWNVSNFDDEAHGRISLEKALWESDNSVFTDLAMNPDGRGLTGGAEAVVNTAEKLGVSADFGDELHPSLVLGTEEVSPLDMAHAYATIANEGRRMELRTISRVTKSTPGADKEVVYKAPQPRGEQVISPQVAAKATEILVGDVKKGIAYKADLEDRTVAGKTGTSERFFDSWFIGYTPQLTTAVWMGYAEGGATLEGLLNLGGKYVGPLEPPTVIWREYNRRVLADEPVREFDGVNVSRYDPPPEPKRETTTPGTTSLTPDAASGG